MLRLMFGKRLLPALALAAFLLGLPRPLSAQSPLDEKQSGFLESTGRGRMLGRWIELGTNQLSELRRRVDSYANDLPRHHQVGGLIVSTRFADTNRTQVVRYEALEDSAAWTGFYLTGLAYWFAVDRRADTLERIRTTLDGVERLLQVPGHPGYIPAFVGKANDPAYRGVYPTFGGPDPARPGFGKLAFGGTGEQQDLVWLTGVSRDNYSGLIMGLGMVHKYVREIRIRARVSNAIELIIGRLEEDHWRINDGHGHETFATPMLAAAILRAGTSINTNRHLREYETYSHELLELPAPASLRYGNVRSAVFAAANLVTLTGLENLGRRRLGYQDQINRLWHESGAQLNPWLAVAYVNAFDHAPADTVATATIQGLLASFPPAPRWTQSSDRASTNGLDLVTANGRIWSRHSLKLSSQAVAPFQWLHSSTDPDPGTNEPVAHPGLDLFTPYWMARDAGVIPDEAAPLAVSGSGLRRPIDFRTRTNILLSLPPSTPVGESNSASRPRP